MSNLKRYVVIISKKAFTKFELNENLPPLLHDILSKVRNAQVINPRKVLPGATICIELKTLHDSLYFLALFPSENDVTNFLEKIVDLCEYSNAIALLYLSEVNESETCLYVILVFRKKDEIANILEFLFMNYTRLKVRILNWKTNSPLKQLIRLLLGIPAEYIKTRKTIDELLTHVKQILPLSNMSPKKDIAANVINKPASSGASRKILKVFLTNSSKNAGDKEDSQIIKYVCYDGIYEEYMNTLQYFLMKYKYCIVKV